jgi:hypothetical protein
VNLLGHFAARQGKKEMKNNHTKNIESSCVVVFTFSIFFIHLQLKPTILKPQNTCFIENRSMGGPSKIFGGERMALIGGCRANTFIDITWILHLCVFGKKSIIEIFGRPGQSAFLEEDGPISRSLVPPMEKTIFEL